MHPAFLGMLAILCGRFHRSPERLMALEYFESVLVMEAARHLAVMHQQPD
jgi:hypothetical protein